MINKDIFKFKKSLVDWFGNRGEEIKTSWIKLWFVIDDNLYIQWSEKAPSYLKPDKPYDINWFNWKALCWEIQDEGYLKDFEHLLESKS
jgi:hypothetical protein